MVQRQELRVMLRSNLIIAFAVLLAIASPLLAYGEECTSKGYTVIFVNGVLNTKDEAEESRFNLGQALATAKLSESITVQLGYNPSHLAGAGDLIQSIFQAFSSSVSNYDLNTILMQIHPEVTTRKILLVGHSQGTFYTNEMYNYLVAHGVPKESIAVYNLATPASFVAGGGRYVTSSNDKLINKVRDAEVNGNVGIYANSYYTVGGVVASALRANVNIPKETGWETDDYGGHHFDVYLDGAGTRIVNDINTELAKLKNAHF